MGNDREWNCTAPGTDTACYFFQRLRRTGSDGGSLFHYVSYASDLFLIMSHIVSESRKQKKQKQTKAKRTKQKKKNKRFHQSRKVSTQEHPAERITGSRLNLGPCWHSNTKSKATSITQGCALRVCTDALGLRSKPAIFLQNGMTVFMQECLFGGWGGGLRPAHAAAPKFQEISLVGGSEMGFFF